MPTPSCRRTEVVLAAVKQNGFVLRYAKPEGPLSYLKNDREVVLAAVKQYGWALKYADPELKKDREVVLAAVKQKGYAPCMPTRSWCGPEGRAGRRETGLAGARYADQELQNDEEILTVAKVGAGIREAVGGGVPGCRPGGRAGRLEGVRDGAQVCRPRAAEGLEIVLNAVKQNSWALKDADSKLKKDMETFIRPKQNRDNEVRVKWHK